MGVRSPARFQKGLQILPASKGDVTKTLSPTMRLACFAWSVSPLWPIRGETGKTKSNAPCHYPTIIVPKQPSFDHFGAAQARKSAFEGEDGRFRS